jgi:hypothetical protein
MPLISIRHAKPMRPCGYGVSGFNVNNQRAGAFIEQQRHVPSKGVEYRARSRRLLSELRNVGPLTPSIFDAATLRRRDAPTQGANGSFMVVCRQLRAARDGSME